MLHIHFTRGKKVLIIFASFNKNPKRVFQDRILKQPYEENTLNSLNIFMAFDKLEPSNFKGKCKTSHLKGSIKNCPTPRPSLTETIKQEMLLSL